MKANHEITERKTNMGFDLPVEISVRVRFPLVDLYSTLSKVGNLLCTSVNFNTYSFFYEIRDLGRVSFFSCVKSTVKSDKI